VVLLARHARDREPGSGLGLPLPPHLAGDAAPDLDAMALEVLKSAERGPYDWGFGSRPQEALYWLEAYRVLDAKEYERFGRDWLGRLDRCDADDANALAKHPTFIEYLRRLVSTPKDRNTLLRELERRCHNRVKYTWNCATRDILTADMCDHYKAGRLEEALFSAKERAGIVADPRQHGADLYDHVRILYDLSRAAWEAGDTAQSARWLCLIVQTYPTLRDDLRRYGKDDYLTLVDEEFYTYKDSLGNGEDIIFGDDNGEEVPPESTPLGQHITRLLQSDQIDESVKAVLRALIPQGGNR
jgi:hypothetical protein